MCLAATAACGDPETTAADAGGGGGNPDAAVFNDAAEPDGGVTEDDAGVDAGTTTDAGFVPPSYGQWEKFEPAGAVCSNGSPYKFFVNFSETSSNVVVYFEGGGACWDYASCTGTGVRSAANRDGIPDTHARQHAIFGALAIPVDVIYPLLNNRTDVNPMGDWNKVFIPYCTGDVYSGDTTVMYDDPTGSGAPIEFHHRGHGNVMKTIESLAGMFDNIPKMFVSGCSAGGAGAIINYYFLRTGLNVEQGYLLDDSGPIFPDTATTSRSRPLHDRIRQSWNVDTLISSAPKSEEIMTDFGNLPRVLAEEFPGDRLAHTHFRLDYNYSLYSYERFYEVGRDGEISLFGDGSGLGELGLREEDSEDRSAVYSMWWDDTALLRAQFDAQPNMSYFMPFYRDTNSSHCLTIPGFGEFTEEEVAQLYFSDFPRLAWAGTDLMSAAGELNIRGYVDHLLDDDTPLASYFEEEGEGKYLSCTPDPRYFDPLACAAVR